MKRLASFTAATATLLILAAGIAVAQPEPPPDGSGEGSGSGTGEPPPPPPNHVERIAPADADEPPAEPPPPAAIRPEKFSVAIGFGYLFPGGDWKTPNTASIRFRLPNGLTFEPQVRLTHLGQKTDTGTAEVSSATNEVNVAALARIPVIKNGKADFELLGALGVRNETTDPDGPSNSDSTTTFGFAYGLAVTYWFTPHFQLSMSALNDLVDYSSQKQQMGPGMSVTDSSTKFGAVFNPMAIAMLHLYL